MSKSIRAQQEVQPSMAASIDSPGVDYKQVHPSTRQIIHTLFPEHTRGSTFFVRLLTNAVIKQYTLHGMPKGDSAVVNVEGYAELSQLLRLSYDTTHMYALVFRALGLLYLQTQGKQMTILIPLGAYRFPAALGEILHQLQVRYRDRRPKVRRLINKIIERITSLITIEQEACKQRPDQDELLMGVQRGLSIQGVADPSGQIALGILTEIAPLVITHTETLAMQGEEEISVHLPRFYQVKCIGAATSYKQEAPSAKEEKQVEEKAVALNLPSALPGQEPRKRTTSRAKAECSTFGLQNLRPQEKSEVTTASKTTPRSSAQGRFNSKDLLSGRQAGEAGKKGFAEGDGFAVENLPTDQQAGEAFQNITESAGSNPPIRVDSGKTLPLKNGNGNGKKNNSNNTNYKSDPDPVQQASASAMEQHIPEVPPPIAHPSIRHQALTLAMLIEGDDKNLGAFVDLLRKYDQQAIRAGVIATLLRKHFPAGRRALRAPGGYFTRQVQRFQDAFPEQMMELLETYAQAPYEEIDAALEKQAQAQTVHQRSAVSPVSQPTSHSRRGKPMDEAMATKLARRIAAEDPSVQIKGACKMPDGTYAVKVIIDPLEYHFRSVEDWEIYHTEMQALDQEVVSR